jgi:hypothetical protein
VNARADHDATGIALLAVLFALMLLMLLALPFAVSMSVGADAAMRDVEQVATEQASASVRDLLLADAMLSHPAVDPTPGHDGLDEYPAGVEVPEAMAALRDGGRVLLGGEVLDLQRFLSLDAASPLAFANAIGTSARLREDLMPDATTMALDDAGQLPETGHVWVGGEVVRYGRREGNMLLDLERAMFRTEGFADGTESIVAETLVLDYRCVLAAAWPFLGRGDGLRQARIGWRSVGELAEIDAAGIGRFSAAELDALAAVFAVETQAETCGTWGRPERVFNDLQPLLGRTLIVKSALHVGAGSSVRLRNLRTGAVEYGLVMATQSQRGAPGIVLPSVFELQLLMPVLQDFPALDTVVEPLVPPPVNVNTAPQRVLETVLTHLRRAAGLRVPEANQRRQAAPPFVSRGMAQMLAGELVALRSPAGFGGPSGPFTGWQDLVQRFVQPQLAQASSDADRQVWLTIYRNFETGRDSTLEMGTAPVCFRSGPWVAYRAAASRSRSVVSAGVVGRHERIGVAAAVPGFRLERAWATQEEFEWAFQLDRRAPFWTTTPVQLGHLQPREIGNDPAPRYFPHVVPVAFPGIGLGAPRFASNDTADAGIEPACATTPSGAWPGAAAPRAFESFAQANHRRGQDVSRDGPYLTINTGPVARGAAGGGGGSSAPGRAGGGGGGRHDQIAFPFSQQGGGMGRWATSFWLEPATLENTVLFDYGVGDPTRNRASVVGRDGNLTLEVIDEAGLDPNPGDSPAGVPRTASQWSLPLAELGLPGDTAVHLAVSAPTGRPADLSLSVDGVVRGKPRFVTYLTAALPSFDPSLANNQSLPGASGNDRYVDLQVESTEGFPTVGVLRVGLELFEYSAISGNSFRCRWADSLGGRGARQIGREHRPNIPVDPNGEPTIDIDDLRAQGVNLDVFPEHPVGSTVELYGYSALVSEDTAMMVGETALTDAVGAFAVARAFVQNPQAVSITTPNLTLNLGRGMPVAWSGNDIELADPVPTGAQNQPPPPAQAEIANAFATGGGFALLIQRRRDFELNVPGQLNTTTSVGGVELVRYQSRQGTTLRGVQRAQQIPGQDNQINRDVYDGTARNFVTDWENWPLPGNNQATLDDVPTLIVWVVPVSLSVQNTNVIWNPQTTLLTEWLQILPRGNDVDTEWVRYDAVVENRHVVRANRGAWRDVAFQLTQSFGADRVQVGQLGVNQAPDPLQPPWGTVTPTANHIGYTPQIESRYPQIHRARQALRFRGDPFTGTSSHAQSNAVVLPCHRLQLQWGNHGAYSGRVGRHDRVALVQGSVADGSTRPGVEWHTVNWQARRYNSDNLSQNRTPEELLGPWPFQLAGLRAAVRVPLLGPPAATVVDDPRLFDRLVKFPSGELPAAYCQNPTVGAGAAGELPMRGFVDEVEVTGHVALDLVLDDTFGDAQRAFTVNRAVTMHSAGGLWFQNDLSAALPRGGGLVQIGTEIVAYQSHQDGVFQVAQNGRGLLNSQARGHDRGERVLFLTHRPAAILTGGVGPRESALAVQALGALPPRGGTVLIGTELAHYAWVRAQGDGAVLEMPRWQPPPDDPDETQARGLLRGRYGTVPQSVSSGTPVIGFPTRYWDRHAARCDDPELAYFQLTTNEAPVYYRTLRWREETRDARVAVECLVRADQTVPWTADPARTPGLWLLRGGTQSAPPHLLDRQSTRLEIRFATVYQPGSIDLQTFRAHAWKTSARVEDVRLEYEGQGRVFDEQVTVR